MSLLSKGLKKLAGNVSKVAKVPVLGTLIKSIPGVGLAVSGAQLISEGYDLAKRAGVVKAGSSSGPPQIAPPPGWAGAVDEAGLVKTLPGSTITRVLKGAGKVAGGTAVAVGVERLLSGGGRRTRKDGKPYKNPTMNPFNAKALNRAHRRIEGFSNTSRKVLREIGVSVSQTRRPPIRKRG